MIIWGTDNYRDGGTIMFKTSRRYENMSTGQFEDYTICIDKRIGTKTPGRITWWHPSAPGSTEPTPTELQEFKEALVKYLEIECYRVDQAFKSLAERGI